MKLYEMYLQKINEQEDNISTKKKIIDFFKDNPNPDDNLVHSFSEELGIDTHEFEGMIYKILSSFLSEGKSKDFNGTYDPKEISMGIKVEMEHTNCQLIAERIAKDHLAEIPDYYTRLKKMEEEAGIKD